jgi:hypothetical protein
VHHKQKTLASSIPARVSVFLKWCGAGSNRRHKDFQSFALPTELPHHLGTANITKGLEKDKNTLKNDVLTVVIHLMSKSFSFKKTKYVPSLYV